MVARAHPARAAWVVVPTSIVAVAVAVAVGTVLRMGRRGGARAGGRGRSATRHVDQGVGVGREVAGERRIGALELGVAGGREGVDAARPPLDAPGVVLVAEGVAEGLHGAVAVDEVAVAVQPAVDLGEAEGSVPVEDLQTRSTEGGAADRRRTGAGRWQRRALVGGWPTTSLPGDGRPEDLAQLDESFPDPVPLLPLAHHRSIEVDQACEEVVALDLELEPATRPEAAAHAVVEERSAVDGAGLAGAMGAGP